MVDIGGGSTELVVGHNPAEHADSAPEVVVRSLDIGCVRVSERFLPRDPPRPEDLARARAAVTDEIMAERNGLPMLTPDSPLVGLAGTVSTLASLEAGVIEYDRARIHHAVLRREDVERWLAILSAEDAHTRLTCPGMSAGREDVIVGGALILAVVMSVFGRERCLVSEDDILDGLAASLLRPPRGAR